MKTSVAGYFMTWKTIIVLLSVSTILLALSCTPSAPTPVTSPVTTTADYSGPWSGVPVYRGSNSPITTRVNETFSIVLPPAPLFGWGWQNNDLTAFSLLETKTILGPANEPNPFGPDAFLFKALAKGTFQITMYVPSKPPQQLESFNVVVNP